jgi:hypothetical protein
LDFTNANINYTHDEASYAGGTLSIDAAGNGIDIVTYAVTVQVYDTGSSNFQQVMTNVILDTNNGLVKVDLPAGDFRIAIQGIRA